MKHNPVKIKKRCETNPHHLEKYYTYIHPGNANRRYIAFFGLKVL